MTTFASHDFSPLLARRLAVLRQIDRATHDACVAALPACAEVLEGEADTAALADLLAQVATEAPDAARALAGRLDALPAALGDLGALRKWALHGLQRHRDDAKRRQHYFEWDDPLAFADQRTELDSTHLLSRRESLLHYLAGFGFAEHRIELHEPQAVGRVPPAVKIGAELLQFPRRSAAVAPGERDVLYRAAVAHAAAHLRHSPLGRLAGNRPPPLLALMGLLEDARVERLMARDFPGLTRLWGSFHTATRGSAGFDFAGLAARLARALHEPGYADSNPWVDKGRRLFDAAAAAADPHAVGEFDGIARQLAADMDKMHLRLPREWRLPPAYRDDNSLLWNLNAARPEDETRHQVREHFEMRARDDMPPDLRHAEVDLRRRSRYPEWDHRLEALREEWATVIEPAPRTMHGKALRRAAPAQQRVRGLDRTPDRAIRLARLAEGDELDLNAAIDSAVHRRARVAPDGRVFMRHGRRRRATAIVLLMDLSASTGRFVSGSFTTVMEVEKRAATLVAQALDSTLDRVAVHGFASNGRHEVHYQRIKDFDEPFGGEAQARLTRLDGGLSTRMGAALRHASAALAGEQADHKVILMLTDGEPSDIDVFEDDYLVEDARHAVTSAATQGIRTFCLTLDRQADAYVQRIFGSRNYLIADRAAAFAGHTGEALVRLVAH